MLAAAKAFSASSVAITDIRPGNLPVAQILGAKYALDQSKAVSTAENVEAIRAVFPEGPDIVIDCVGFSSTITVSCKRCTTGCCRMLQDGHCPSSIGTVQIGRLNEASLHLE